MDVGFAAFFTATPPWSNSRWRFSWGDDMSTYRSNLLTRRDAVAAELAAITNITNTTEREEYRMSLYNELREIDERLNSPNSRFDATAGAGERPAPWTVWEYGET